jgi:hypothetical protein
MFQAFVFGTGFRRLIGQAILRQVLDDERRCLNETWH